MKIKRSELKQLALKNIGSDSLESQNQVLLKICTARAARLSYMTFDGDIDYEKDIKLHDQLLDSKHFSPFEHCARAMTKYEYDTFIKGKGDWYQGDEGIEFKDQNVYGWCNNFRGFIPYRYLLENKEE